MRVTGRAIRFRSAPGHRAAPILILTREAVRQSPLATGVLVALVGIASLVPVGLAGASGVLVTRLIEQGDGAGAGGRTSYVGVAVVLAILFLTQQLMAPAALALAESVGRRLNRAVSDRVMAALARPVGLEHLDDPVTPGLLGTIGGGFTGTTARDAVVGAVNMSIARGAAASGVLLIIWYRWWLALALLGAYGYAMTIVSRSYQRALASAEGAPARLRRAMYLKDVVSTAPAAKDVRLFGLASWMAGRYRAEWAGALGDIRSGRRGVAGVSLASAAAAFAAQGLTFGVLAADMVDGRISVAWFTTLTVAATGLLGMVTVWPDLVNIAAGGAMLEAVGELEEVAGRYPEAGSGRQLKPSRAIVFEDVGFRYPRGSSWVLRHLDLTIPIGSSTAIVGVNGAGKTTLVRLACGLYQPTEGRILVDGVDVRELDRGQWQRRFAALQQDWVKWRLPLRDNVLLGAPGRPWDQGALDDIARRAGLDVIIESLPAGWDTVLSREFGGVDLSGGQWQRVGLARSLFALTGGADVIVLDEPTAALDVRGEAEFYDMLLAATPGKTIVLISHRFSTTRHAGQIVVLADGAVAERGSHAELMAAGGEYAWMFNLQAARFSEVDS